MEFSVFGFILAELGVFIIAFMKGAFGGGFATIGIPLLSLGMDPITAGALLAPLFVAMDVFAFRYWRADTWSMPDLKVLVPSMVTGIVVGYLLLSVLDHRLVAILIAIITLIYSGLWFYGLQPRAPMQRRTWKGIVAGGGAGITTMVAHAGGPPVAMYLLRLGLSKEVYAGTTAMFFTVANAVKAVPWVMLVEPTPEFWLLMVLCLPVVPFGVWAGWYMHARVDDKLLYRMCYGLLVLTALKLLWDGIVGYL